MYADDLSISKPLHCAEDMSLMQSDIEKISDWSEANHLNINVAKTKYMIISRKKKAIPYFGLFLNGHQLERVSSFRLLSVIIDENLSWSEHIISVSSKAKRTLGIIYRQFYLCDKATLLTMYKSLVLPILDYCCFVWDPHLVKHVKLLESVQIFACRIATGLWDMSHDQLRSRCNLPLLSVRRQYFKYCFVYKALNNLTYCPPSIFKFKAISSVRTRNSHNLQLYQFFARTASSLNSFLNSSVSLWNNLPYHIVSSKAHYSFKLLIRNLLSL